MESKRRRCSIITIMIIFVMLVSMIFGVAKIVAHSYNKKRLELESNYTEIKDFVVPKVYFKGDILDLKTKKETRNVSVSYTVDDEEKFVCNAKIKLQGTSSLGYPKKNYTVTFYEDEECTSKKKIDLGWGAQSKYCFKANYMDSTQSRNIVTARIMAQIQAKYELFTDCPNNGLIDGYPIELYINDEYWGLYTCNIPKDAWMFNMDEDNPDHIVIVANKNGVNSATRFNKEASKDNKDFEIEIGVAETEEEIDAIYEKLNRLIHFVMDTSDEEFIANFDEYLNLDSCLNYLSMLYLGNCADNVTKNMLLVTYDGKVWYPSMYDLDSTWGIKYTGAETLDPKNEFQSGYIEEPSLLWERIQNCFKEELKDRYNELRCDILTNENIIREFKDFQASIPDEVWQRDRKKWKVPGVHFGIEQIERDLEIRSKYVDEVINNL